MSSKIIEKIKIYPITFGLFISVIVSSFIFVVVEWLPRVDQAWTRNNSSVRSAYFTIVLFAVFVVRPRQERRRNAFVFWASICTFFLIHVSFVFYYSTRVHPILLKEWIVILILESFILSFGIDWLTRRFRTGRWRTDRNHPKMNE